jgi:hypothetical protein
LWVEGVRDVEIHQGLSAQCGDSVLPQWSMYEYIDIFINGWKVTDERACPSTWTMEGNTEQVCALIIGSRRVTSHRNLKRRGMSTTLQ